MHDSIVVQVSDGDAYLVGQFLDPRLRQLEIPELNVVKQIFALHVLQHYIVIVGVFEEIDEGHNIWVLRLLQDVDLTALLVYLNRLHIFLVYRFDSHFLARLLVRCQLDQAELALAEIVLKLVVVEQVCVTNNVVKFLEPRLLLIVALEVEDTRFIRWENDLYGVELTIFRLAVLGWHLLDKSTDQ